MGQWIAIPEIFYRIKEPSSLAATSCSFFVPNKIITDFQKRISIARCVDSFLFLCLANFGNVSNNSFLLFIEAYRFDVMIYFVGTLDNMSHSKLILRKKMRDSDQPTLLKSAFVDCKCFIAIESFTGVRCVERFFKSSL